MKALAYSSWVLRGCVRWLIGGPGAAFRESVWQYRLYSTWYLVIWYTVH